MRRDRHLASLLMIAVLAVAAPALADKSACLSSVDKGQTLRDAGKLRAARDQFLVCANAECPHVVQIDCARWANELDASIPTVVCVAADAKGDLTAVRVRFDGEPLLDQLDGASVEQRVVVGQGDKNHKVAVRFDAPRPIARPPDVPVPPPRSPSTTPVAALVFAGLGVIALGSFAYLGITGKNHLADLHSGCAPYCSDAEIASAKRQLIAADISLGVGVVALGLSAFFLFHRTSSSPKASLHIAPPRAASAAWHVPF
jgi:hypothetical protein